MEKVILTREQFEDLVRSKPDNQVTLTPPLITIGIHDMFKRVYIDGQRTEYILLVEP